MLKNFFYHGKSLFLCFIFLAIQSAYGDLPDFTEIVEKNGPAVVNIQVTNSGEKTAQSTPDDNQRTPDDQDIPEIFRHFFGPQGPRIDRPRAGSGSGFIISQDGYVLTNNHVVENFDQVIVRLSDRRELEAKIVGKDPRTDLALLKLNATGLPTVSIGDSSKLKPGQWVLAIGSPFNFDHSVTHGVVSSIGRTGHSFGADQQFVPFIQSDVPINPGNSGGPLFNMEGQVVGINSQIFTRTGGYMGVSFSIPIDVAMSVVEQIKTTGHVSHGMIGVYIQEVSREHAESLKLPRPGGALVNGVNAGGPAEKAGVQVGDVIMSFNGRPIDRSSDLPPMVGATKPGTRVDLGVYRDGKNTTLSVVVGELPKDKKGGGSSGNNSAKPSNSLGITVDELTAEQRKQLGLKDQGVVITQVEGAARRAGLQSGDVILMVGRKSVKTPDEFNDEVKGAQPGDSVMLLVRRGEATTFIAVAVPKPKEKE